MNVISQSFRSALNLICPGLLCKSLILFVSASFAMTGCNSKTRDTATGSENATPAVKAVMTFNADTAYSLIEQQVAMGPRVPGTPGSKECGEWIKSRLIKYGADSVITQNTVTEAHNGDRLPLTNIMGRFGATGQTRVLLVAHYDTRPWADRERVHENINTPIPGANDGGSGVAVLLEIARQFSEKRPDIAVDMLFVDGEDYGKAEGWSNNDSTWCLGTQYWTEHMPADYEAMPPRFGILLDMVGSKHARFNREFFSDRYAPQLVDKIWQIADASGFGSIFINRSGGSVIDDHIFISRSGIPTIDIVDCNNAETDNFPASWHTLSDDMTSIDTQTLGAVGQTVTNVLYRERP